jgi:hypothetical protein
MVPQRRTCYSSLRHGRFAVQEGNVMIWGLPADTFTLIHTALSLVALAAGIDVVASLAGNRTVAGWTALFLLAALATDVTAFGFPFTAFLPSQYVTVLSLVALCLAIIGRYSMHYAGAWRVIYAISIVLAVYLDAFVAVVQAFQKIPALHDLAPTQSEPPFAITQGVVLVLFIVLGILAVRRFHPAAAKP